MLIKKIVVYNDGEKGSWRRRLLKRRIHYRNGRVVETDAETVGYTVQFLKRLGLALRWGNLTRELRGIAVGGDREYVFG